MVLTDDFLPFLVYYFKDAKNKLRTKDFGFLFTKLTHFIKEKQESPNYTKIVKSVKNNLMHRDIWKTNRNTLTQIQAN